MKKLLAAVAVTTCFAVAGLAPVVAGGETRTISLIHIHTGESLTITYKKDGQYIPSAMRQINYLLRDWRKNQVISIDPRTIDLVWELHEDLGSHEPIHIVCGYRSASTNAFLHRIGRHVARESQHIRGNAIDFYFPDVPTRKIRNVALVMQVGGVGYYRSAGGPTGFMHVDSGHVRHWGPAISSSEMAQIFHDGERVLGRRLRSTQNQTEVASADDSQAKPGFLSRLLGLDKSKTVASQAANQVANAAQDRPAATDDAGMADLSADASTTPKSKLPPSSKLTETQMASLGNLSEDAATPPQGSKLRLPAKVAAVDAETDVADEASNAIVIKNRIIPKPRLKPVEVLLLAAANMKTPPQLIRINAASAPPPDQSGNSVGPTGQGLGMLMQAAALDSNGTAAAKTGLGSELRNGTSKGLPVIRPLIASATGNDIDWWPAQMLRSPEEAIRRDGQPALIGTIDQDVLPRAAVLSANSSDGSAYAATVAEDEQHAADGKGDLVGTKVN
ncbi:MAG: DUF882 domain-containing protein [Aestuariivirga sp.]